jgi:acetyl-CoA synthetase
VFHWCREELGVTANEIFRLTEMNYIVGNSHTVWPVKPGSMGRRYLYRIAVIDDDGCQLPAGCAGDVAVHRTWIDGTPDPVFFLGYWGNEAATAAKYSGDWCRTGDHGAGRRRRLSLVPEAARRHLPRLPVTASAPPRSKTAS